MQPALQPVIAARVMNENEIVDNRHRAISSHEQASQVQQGPYTCGQKHRNQILPPERRTAPCDE
jgi:hypothetical protein